MTDNMIDKMQTANSRSVYYWILVAVVATLYFVAAKARLPLTVEHNIVSIVIFASEGIALGAALFFGKKVWPGIFLGQLLVALDAGMGIPVSVEISAVNALEAVLGVYLFERYRLNKELSHMRDIVGLGILIVCVLQPFSALFGNMALWIHGVIEGSSYLQSTLSWWFGNVMGQLLFTPFVLLLLSNYKRIRMVEFLLYGTAFAIFLYIVEMVFRVENLSLLLIFTIPVVTYVLARKGMVYGTFLVILVAVFSSYSIFLGTGVFSKESMWDNIINVNFYILAHIFMVLIAGVLFEERKQQELLLQKRVEREVERNRQQQMMMFQQSRFVQMGEMIAMIAHQWRQPLHSLSLLIHVAVKKYEAGTLDAAAVSDFQKRSQQMITHMSETIDDFRNFFKPDKTKTDFDLHDALMDVIHIVEPMIQRYGIEVVTNMDSGCVVYGYPNEFSQAILNILNNAKDALLEQCVENPKIYIGIKKEKGRAVVTVEDNAGGIPLSFIDKIFDPYFSTKENKNGTGLGLYMSRIIVSEHMHGTIDVANKDEGACFTLILPMPDRIQ